MSEKSVLVTGATKGIGKAIALRMAKDGYKVVLNARKKSMDKAFTLKDEIVSSGGKADVLGFDVGDREECQRAIKDYVDANGVFWGIVLNAGISRDNTFVAIDDEDWDDVLRTNLGSFYNVLSPVMMKMMRAREGRIIAISSVSGVIGNRGQVNYSASKAGLIGAVKALACEAASRGITVNAIAPGFIETEMLDGLPIDEMIKAIPMRRCGTPEEVASLASFLMSEEASYITRQVININGGLC